jgi:hypothetical protein
MKFILFFLSFVSFSYAQELPLKAKEIIFDEISSMVFFEDEGLVRAPQKIEDFTFLFSDEFIISVSGESFSDWDQKMIGYQCQVNVLSRGMIESNNDVEIICDLTGENWPYY